MLIISNDTREMVINKIGSDCETHVYGADARAVRARRRLHSARRARDRSTAQHLPSAHDPPSPPSSPFFRTFVSSIYFPLFHLFPYDS